jgi:hypothetical protein
MRDDFEIVRGHVRDRSYVRVSHGLFLRMLATDPSEPQDLRELRAWLMVAPPDGRFTHVTGAALRGWALPQLPEAVPVFVSTNEEEKRPRRPGLEVTRLTHPTEPDLRLGLPVESCPEILLRAARDLAHLDLVALVDSARRRGDVSASSIRPILRTSRPGVVALRRAWETSSDRSESAWETHLRSFHRAVDVDVEPQVNIFSEAGGFVGRADLLIRGTRAIQEYDGAVHRGRGTQRRDLRRERRFAATPYRRRGYTAEDLLHHDLEMLREVDAILGRAHDPARINLWRELVAESCLTQSGRDRLWNRWWGGPPSS